MTHIYTHISLKLLKRQAGVRPGWRLVAIDRAEEGADLPEWQSRLKALSMDEKMHFKYPT